jgi:DNA mismatch repair protein MutL
MSSPRIHKLDRMLVNKIAAGEVVERPASVVKELVENSLDAEASEIEVVLDDGGKKLIRVTDDGDGLAPEDLPLAFESHATSKLENADDLFQIGTLGFRGEALASIASVGHCRAVSRERGAVEGAEIECDAGRLGEVRVCGAREGTIIEVRDLFFNTPARLKFLRSTATELRHIVEMINRLALPHPTVAFQLVHNGRRVLALQSCESFRERLLQALGPEICERLLPVRSETAAMTVSGFISPPGEGAPSSTQYIFLNGRYIRDRALQRAVAEAYRSRMMRGKFPAVFLSIRIDPARVDVNVHPTKIEVRFRDSGAVFAQTMTALEKALRSTGVAPAKEEIAPEAPPGERRQEDIRQAVADFFQRSARTERQPYAPPSHSLRPTAFARREEAPAGREPAPFPPSAAEAAKAPPVMPKARNIAQIHDSYIIEEVPGGFRVIDQHALHERILYEELQRRVRDAAVPRQKMLIPEVVDLPPEHYLLALELREPLLKMGVEIEPFGERTIAVHAVPHLASKVHPRELLLEMLAELGRNPAGGQSDREAQLLYVIACKAAVKAGDRLSRPQLEALLEQRDRLGPEPTCPHGRPTTLYFDLADLEKRFKRT